MNIRPPARPAERACRAIGQRVAFAAAVLVICAALVAPATAAADSMSLSIAPEPVANLTSQITWAASSEEGTLPVVAVNNPGVPCATNPAADDGQTITPGHIFEAGSSGSYTGAVNYTPLSTGAYTACGWLELPIGLIETDGGPVTAAASLPLQVRAPLITLNLTLPRRPAPYQPFTLDLTASAEADREVVVEGFALTRRGCPVNPAAEGAADHLIDQGVTGGPWKFAANVEALPAGSYVFCAWAFPSGEELDPQATAQLILRLGQHSTRHAKRTRRHDRPRR